EILSDRSDQYALGLILYEITCLKPAVTGKSPLKIVMRQQDAEKDPMNHIARLKIARELKAIVNKATQKDPNKRYASVKELAADIKRYQRDEPVLAKRDTILQASRRWMKRHTGMVVAGFVLLVLFSLFTLTSVAGVYQVRLAMAKYREGQVSNLLTTVAAQASLIDGQFLKYEGLLSVLAVTGEELLGRPPTLGEQSLFTSEDFKDPENHPKDLADSSRYNMPISVEHPVYVIGKDVAKHTVTGSMYQLSRMDHHYKQVLLRSEKEEAATYTPKRAQRAISEVGMPLAWAYIGLENGLYSHYPGHGSFKNFDPRDRNWYKLAKGTRGPTWGAPHADVSGMGLVLSCANSLYTKDQEFIGVAGIDVTFDFIIEELLEIHDFPKGSESFLLDQKGKIVVRSSKKGKKVSGASARQIRMPTFHIEEVVKEMDALKSGYKETYV
ncbi:MAG: hypothetical protein HN348_33800, partial [Proteobacteria bacterium]|nr:hypothetical protein [Pseudomonadota bacterium]